MTNCTSPGELEMLGKQSDAVGIKKSLEKSCQEIIGVRKLQPQHISQ